MSFIFQIRPLFRFSGQKSVKFLSWFFWKIEDIKIHSEINWSLVYPTVFMKNHSFHWCRVLNQNKGIWFTQTWNLDITSHYSGLIQTNKKHLGQSKLPTCAYIFAHNQWVEIFFEGAIFHQIFNQFLNGQKWYECFICRVHSIFCFSFFGQSDQKPKNQLPKTKKSAVLFVYFLYKKSSFCLKMTADFFVFGHFDQKRKNGMNSTINTACSLNDPALNYYL